MKCPVCGGDTKVLATRGVIRSRECKLDISHKFETEEKVTYVGARPQGRPSKSITRDDNRRWLHLT